MSTRYVAAPVRWWMWGLPVSFLVHDGEEMVATLERGLLTGPLGNLTVNQTAAAMLFELALLWVAAALGVWARGRDWRLWTFTVVLIGWTLHGVVHVITGILGDGYTFGALTALPVVVTYGCLALWRMRAEGFISWRDALLATPIAAVAAPVVLLTVHAVGLVLG